ncbi:MAG: hypothetical protein AAGA28_19060 [Pseudomonadota bacterium]
MRLLAILALVFAGYAFEATAVTGQCAGGGTCDLNTPACEKGSKCHYDYNVGGATDINVTFMCSDGASVSKKEKCASPDVWQGTCKWSGNTCGCESTDQGFELNVTATCGN